MIWDEIDSDLGEILADAGITVEIDGRPVSAMVSNPVLGHQLALGGLDDESELEIRCRKSAFNGMAMPKTGSRVTVDGRVFRVDKVTVHPASPVVVISASK
jgi:hypothetical protein